MTQTLRSLRIIHVGLLVSMLLYLAMVERLSLPPAPRGQLLYHGLLAVAAVEILAVILVRRAMILGPARILSQTPDSSAVLVRWRTGYMLTYALSESVVVLGVLLRVLGFPLAQVWPFYVTGAVLLLFFRPRLP
jgi:hypothetical protein